MSVPFFNKSAISIIYFFVITKILVMFLFWVKCSINIIYYQIINSSTISLLTKSRVNQPSVIKEKEFVIFIYILQLNIVHFEIHISILSKWISSNYIRFLILTILNIVLEILKPNLI